MPCICTYRGIYNLKCKLEDTQGFWVCVQPLGVQRTKGVEAAHEQSERPALDPKMRVPKGWVYPALGLP